ncbi:hypothetical protein GCM10010335_19770 [Streptomyces galbus]|nr:hypothetical protein GCM10010335_19770 [Streptomyces galbus]
MPDSAPSVRVSVGTRVRVCTGATSRMIAAAEGGGSGTSGAETAARPLSVPYAMSAPAGVCDPWGTDRPRSEDSGTGTQCGVRHISATRGVR